MYHDIRSSEYQIRVSMCMVKDSRLKTDENSHVQICDEVSWWVGAHRLQTYHETNFKVSAFVKHWRDTLEEGRRQVGRPRRRRLDAADRDGTRMLKCRNWRKSAEDRQTWRQRLGEAKAQVELWRHTRGRELCSCFGTVQGNTNCSSMVSTSCLLVAR